MTHLAERVSGQPAGAMVPRLFRLASRPSIEADLRAFVQVRLDLPQKELVRRCEQAIRNYDPCISCATHFLDLTMEHK